VRYSILLATVGRTRELHQFLASLAAQTWKDFEVLIIDQNSDDRVEGVVAQYADQFPIRRMRSARGHSRAFNTGLAVVSGDIVAFPDDDCWYAPDTLEKMARAFCENSICDGFTGRGVDDSRPADYVFFSRRSGWVNKKNVWRCCTSISIFLRSRVIRAIGPFDESLGAGSQHGRQAAEEGDYLIRAIESGFRIYYCVDLCILHPYPVPTYSRDVNKKGYGYSVGFGHVLRKYRYPFSFVCYQWLRALGGAVVSLLTLNFAKSRYHLAVLRGRILGWLG